MDATTGRIASYATTLIYADLPADVVHECKRRIVDTVGCALGAFDEPPSRIARAVAERASVSRGARVLGTGQRALPELAAFANGVMARYLDGNDVFPGGGGHPSDVISAVLAAADLADAGGPAVITGIVLGYEIHGALFRAACMRDHGLDHVFYTAVGSAVGAAKVLGLDRDRIAQALALAVTPNIALHATRRGELSMWKGAAAGNAARNGVFAALLAAAGMTGPDKPIDGSDGVRELLGTFEFGEFGQRPSVPATARRLQVFLERVSLAVADNGGDRAAAADSGRRHRIGDRSHLLVRLERDRKRSRKMASDHA
jgi:2-methylcitrate dehydratase